VFTARTVAATITDPLESRALPNNCPRESWAAAGLVERRKIIVNLTFALRGYSFG